MSLVAHPRVFLSYARQDGEEFATALRRRLAMEEPEITLWQDRAQMEGGVGWWAQIEAALDHAKFLVIVMTPQALVSEMTRKEWRYARQRGVVVYPVKGVPDAQLNYAALPTWMRKAHFFDIGKFTGGKWKDSKEWETFVNYLKSDRRPVRVPFMAPDLPTGFVPRRRELEDLFQLVIDSAHEQQTAITTALGAGGYGKTTLATALCHDERVIDAFDDGVLWTTLGQTPHVIDEVGRLHEALTGHHVAFVDVTDAAAKLAEKLEHRHCLLVIDDVWDRAHLEPFLKGGKQCARLITTRRFDLVERAARVRVDEMSVTDAVRFLSTAFDPGSAPLAKLAPLAERLGEWPLLLKLAAGMMRKRLDRGDSADGALTYVSRALDKRGVTAFDQSETKQRNEAVRRTVAASLDQLSADDGGRFRELAIFPKDTAIPLTTLERLWALDDLDTVDCAQRLDDVSLLSLDLRRGVVTLHDVMRVYLLAELGGATRVHARLVDGYGNVDQLPDAYGWRWLPYHILHAGRHDDLRALLLRPEWLQAKVRVVDPPALIRDFDLLDGDRDLEVIQAALRLALPALVADPSQLAEQLIGRLPMGFSDRLDTFRHDLTRTAPRPRLHARWPNLQDPGGALVQTLPHTSVKGAMLLPDGRALSWSGDGTLRVWDLATGDSRTLTGHAGSVYGAMLLPDGHALSWSSDGTLRVWDLATGDGRVLSGHEDQVHAALLLPDARALSCSADGTLRVWDVATADSRAFAGHEGSVYGALLLPDGRALSWSGDHTLRVWDLMTGDGRVLAGHEDSVHGALLLPDGRALSWSGDATLRVWDLATGESRVLAGHEDSVYGALLLPDGRALSWSGDATLRVWDLATGTGRILTGHHDRVHATLLLPDARALSCSADGTLRVWALTTGDSRTLTGHEASVYGALLLPDGRVLSWSGDDTMRVWDLTTGEGRALTSHGDWVYGALLMPDGRPLSWSEDGTLRVWDLATGQGRTLSGHDRWVHGASLLPDARALSWSADGTLRVWDLTTGEGDVLTGHEDWVYGALLLPDGRALSWSGDRTLRVWDLSTREGRALIGHEDSVHGALQLPDGAALSWSADGTLRVWDLSTGDSRILTGHEDWVHGALLLPDGRPLSWSEDGTLRVWHLTTGQGRTLTGHKGSVHGALVLPDERVLSWSGDGTLRVWDLETGRDQVLSGHERWVHGALLLPGSRTLSWSADGTLLLSDLTTGTRRTLTGHKGLVNGVLPLPDERALSWSVDRTLRLWDLDTGDGRALTGHDASVHGALLLPGGRVLSWSADRSIRLRDISSDDPDLAFYFDATPTVVLPERSGGFLVGDALGRIHVLEVLEHV